MVQNEKNAVHFYNDISDFYDHMTDFENRLEREQKIMQDLRNRHKLTTVLDAACGTGIHSIALSSLGVSVTAIDVSPKMIERAKQNANSMRANVEFLTGALSDLDEWQGERFDGILFLGNSLPHITDRYELLAILHSYHRLLSAGGTLFIQILNYKKILADKNRIISIKKYDNKEFIRFYDFLEFGLRFNLLQIEYHSGIPKYSLNSTRLNPYTQEDLERVLKDAGFQIESLNADLHNNVYNQDQSENLVITAKKTYEP